jgi:phosphatidylglycerophosphatase A
MTIYASLATVFGIGRVRYAPGTAGSAAAMVIAVPVLMLTGWVVMGILALVVTALAFGRPTATASKPACPIRRTV